MQQWDKAALDFFWNRIGKKTPGRALDETELGSPRVGSPWFLTVQITGLCFQPFPSERCCPRDRRLPLPPFPRGPQMNLWEKELGITFENFCLETKGEFMLCKVTIQPVLLCFWNMSEFKPEHFHCRGKEMMGNISAKHLYLRSRQTGRVASLHFLPPAPFILNFASHKRLTGVVFSNKKVPFCTFTFPRWPVFSIIFHGHHQSWVVCLIR